MKPPNDTINNVTPPAGGAPAAVPPSPPAGAAPPAPPAPAAAAPPAPPAPAPGASPAVTPATHVPTRKLLSDADDELPDAEIYELPARSLKARLQRHTKGELKRIFGTDNPDEIVKLRDEHAAMKKAAEEKRLAEMTEAERYKAQLEASQKAYQDLESRYQGEQMARVVDQEDRRITALVQKHIDAKYLRTEIPRLAAFLAGCSEQELQNDEKLIADWCAKATQESPWMAPGWSPAPPPADPSAGAPGTGTSAGAPPPAPAPVSVPLTNGASGALPGQNANPQFSNGQKSVKDMTEAEWRQYKRQNGLHF